VEPVADPDVIFPVDFNGVQYQVTLHTQKTTTLASIYFILDSAKAIASPG
jgi:hypothetical protein